MRTPLVLEFGDGEYPFYLSLAGAIELQELTKTGIGPLFGRVMAGQYKGEDGSMQSFSFDAQFRVEDLHNIIRLALVGGGMDPVQAKRLTDTYCFPEQPLKPTWELSAAIMYAAMEGYSVKPPQEEKPGSKKKTETVKDGSTRGKSSRTSRRSTNPSTLPAE